MQAQKRGTPQSGQWSPRERGWQEGAVAWDEGEEPKVGLGHLDCRGRRRQFVVREVLDLVGKLDQGAGCAFLAALVVAAAALAGTGPREQLDRGVDPGAHPPPIRVSVRFAQPARVALGLAPSAGGRRAQAPRGLEWRSRTTLAWSRPAKDTAQPSTRRRWPGRRPAATVQLGGDRVLGSQEVGAARRPRPGRGVCRLRARGRRRRRAVVPRVCPDGVTGPPKTGHGREVPLSNDAIAALTAIQPWAPGVLRPARDPHSPRDRRRQGSTSSAATPAARPSTVTASATPSPRT